MTRVRTLAEIHADRPPCGDHSPWPNRPDRACTLTAGHHPATDHENARGNRWNWTDSTPPTPTEETPR